MNHPLCLLKNGWMTLVEEEAGVDLQVRFDPITIANGGEVMEEGDSLWIVRSGKPAGEWISVHPNGTVKLKCYYQLTSDEKSRLHGPCERYFDTGTLLSSAIYVQGIQQGREELYYPSGDVYLRKFYCDGIQVGEQCSYYKTGSPKCVVRYRNGRVFGLTILYHPDGSVKREIAS